MARRDVEAVGTNWIAAWESQDASLVAVVTDRTLVIAAAAAAVGVQVDSIRRTNWTSGTKLLVDRESN